MHFTKLYNELFESAQRSEAFFFADHELDGVTYRIFNYRLASYTDFQMPSALECRGIMFEMDGDTPVRLAARPMQKFFNLYENPFTQELDLSHDNIHSIMMKEDGSLISTFMHGDELRVKSKGSLTSDQAIWALNAIKRDSVFYTHLKEITKTGKTVNMEYCAPHNRIVLNYEGEQLTILNVRDNETGEYYPKKAFSMEIKNRWVKYADELPEYSKYHGNLEQLVHDSPDMVDIEGFVVELVDGTFFKLKTGWYLVQHRAKDNVDSPRKLFEAAIMETTDDLKSLFHDNDLVIRKIEDMESRAAHIYNHVVATVEDFVLTHEKLIHEDNRKEFALLGQERFTGSEKRLFGLAMQEYNARRGNGSYPNYKEFCIKHSKEWGIKDEPPTDD